MEDNSFNKYQTCLLKQKTRGALRGSFLFKRDLGLKCDLCQKFFSVLTPTDFNKMIWVQGETLQFISHNKDIKKFQIELCYHCRQNIFKDSIPTIKFRKELFEVLANKQKC